MPHMLAAFIAGAALASAYHYRHGLAREWCWAKRDLAGLRKIIADEFG